MSLFIRVAGHVVRYVAWAALCGCCIVKASQSTQTPSTTIGPYRIAGILVNAASGEPVRRAVMQALDDGGRTVASCLTDGDGRFALDHLAAGKYQLSASKRGFRTQSYDEHDEFATSIVTGQDQDTNHLDFKLTPNAVLYGTVIDDNGDPVANARIMLFSKPKHPGQTQRMGPGETAMADDIGGYELSDLAPGDYFLAVIADPWYAVHEGVPGRRNPALDVVYPITYFDSTTDEQSATPIQLTGGTRQEVNLSMHAVPALHLSIAVPRKPDGSLARPELQQTIFGNSVSAQSAGFVDAMLTGTVEMDGIAPGRYQLTQGDPPRVVDLDVSANQQVDPSAGSPANAVSGRLRMQSGAPPPDDATVSLERIDNNPGQAIYAADAHEGQFRFESVPPGDWAVAVTSGNETLPVIAVSTGATQRAGNLMTLRERAPEVTVTLSGFEADVRGFAKKDGKGFAGAMIVLLPRNPAQWRSLTRRDQSDSDGSFALHKVVPGDYKLIAIEDGWELDWTSPEAMDRYLQGGTDVRVRESSGKLVQLNTPVAVEER